MNNDVWETLAPFLQEDYVAVAHDSAVGWEALNGKTVLVTGATGEIGREIVKTLLVAQSVRNLDCRIYCHARSYEKVKAVFGTWIPPFQEVLRFVYGDIQSFELKAHIDFIIHSAGPTASEFFVRRPVETIDAIVGGTKHVLDIARKNEITSLAYLSSMEVYGQIDSDNVTETDSGYLNPLSARSSYPQAKRLAETLLYSAYTQFGPPVKIIRPTQVFGTHLGAGDKRVYAQFARAARNGNPIVLHTAGTTRRDYIYTLDAVRAILTILLRGQNGEAYNASNPENYLSIRQMANLAASFNPDSHVVFNTQAGLKKGYAPTVQIRLNIEKLNALNAFSKTSIETMFRHLISDLKVDDAP